MTLHMLELELEPRPLYEWARQIGLTTEDRGYLTHSAMRAAFGRAAPQPFALFGNARNPKIKVLGYAEGGREALLPGLALAEPVLAEIFPEGAIREKVMPPEFPAGAELGFRVECCPVTRCSMPGGKTREKDAFLAACDARPEGGVDRAAVYVAWLAADLARNGAAEMVDGAMQGFRLFTPVRRGDGKGAKGIGRRPRAALTGVLRVRTPDAFSSLLARGVGRHRAFGLGMLLLRPV
ncbi:MAG: type I-E CRISPR-associated protein Cas6/Cse3/CasE [Desulfovibrio aminophilus]|uniref:type I-E CRISPR-associated protein Cas6/Cse3/CasE n=1 Tax=Desulfovibrio aminophilus TaxID=81425 RepID=UPI0039E9F721